MRSPSILCAAIAALLGGIGLCPAADPTPASGELVFHRYSSYEAWDGKLYLYDFSAGSLQCLSDRWVVRPVDHAMNAHVLPGGRYMVFMGVRPGRHVWNEWDIFLWDMQSGQDPIDLTADNMMRDEDPKFSPDGTKIVFKQDGRIRVMGLDGTMLDHIADDPAGRERSMPFYWGSGSIVCMEGAGTTGDLFAFDVASSAKSTISAVAGVQEYYPVPWDADRLLFARWTSATNRNDQLYAFDRRTAAAQPLVFCTPDANYSDPTPVDGRFVVFSGTLPGGHGGYDLFIGDSVTGAVAPIAGGSINGATHELGACYRSTLRHPPVAQSQVIATDEDAPLGIALQASDADGDPMSYVIVGNPAHGSLSGTGASRTYTPTRNFNGTDTFTWKANDGAADSNLATVTVTVRPVNDVPVVVAQSRTTAQDTPVSVTLAGTDADGGTLSFACSNPTHGTLSGSGVVRTYTPAAGYSGADSFTFTAYDGLAYSSAATVSITVTAAGTTLANRGDIGVVARPGSSAVQGGIWTLSAYGGDIWGASDGFQMASRTVSGDVRITARITSIATGDSWAKAGVMIREGRGASARYAMCMNTAAIGSAFQRRLTTGGASSYTTGPYVRPPTWVRVERVGQIVIASTSVDGATWKEIGRQTLALAATVEVGLVASAHSMLQSCTATFSDVQIVTAPAGGG